jgi:hypothetical protein
VELHTGTLGCGRRERLFPPDGKTLIVAETFSASLLAFTIHPDGSLSDRRVWAQIAPAPSWDSIETLMRTGFAPDGCDLDSEGCMWVADAFNARTCRVAPDGNILQTLTCPQRPGHVRLRPRRRRAPHHALMLRARSPRRSPQGRQRGSAIYL